MKVKVLAFHANGNDLIRPYKELTAIDAVPGAYLSEVEPDYHMLIYNFDGLYACVGCYYSNQIERPDFTELVKKNYAEYLDGLLSAKWVNLLQVEIYKHLGRDTEPLFAIREKATAERAERERLEKEKEREKTRKYLEEERARKDAALQKFLAGEQVDKSEFIELCDENGIVLPIQTKGMLNALSHATIGHSQAFVRYPKGKRKNLDRVFSAARELKEKFLAA